jgi:hypothetical protein
MKTILRGVLLAVLLALPLPVQAQKFKGFDAADDLLDALAKLKNSKQRVEISLRSGKTYSGFVGDVAVNFVIVTELASKEFYDALVRIEDISAVEARVREK